MNMKTRFFGAVIGVVALSVVVGCGGSNTEVEVSETPAPKKIDCPVPAALDMSGAPTVIGAPCVTSEEDIKEVDIVPPIVDRVQVARHSGEGDAFLRVYFSEPISARDIHIENITIEPPVTISDASRRGRLDRILVLSTEDELIPDQEYTITLGEGSVTDLAGNALLASDPWPVIF